MRSELTARSLPSPARLKFGSDPDNVRSIIVDSTSNDIHLIVPIFPLGKVAKPPDDFAIDDDFNNAYNRLQRAIGKADLTLMKTLDNKFAHPRDDKISVKENYVMQSHYSLGKLEYIFPKPDAFNRVCGSYNVTDPTGKKVVMKYREYFDKGAIPFFTSSQIVRNASEPKYKVRTFDLMHTTLTDEPAFGKELSAVSAVCQGDVRSCVMNYAAASGKVSEVGIDINGNIIDIHHTKENCTFCVETELTNIFENNIKNSEYILNSASIPQMSAQEGKQEVIKPDEDQSTNNASRMPIDVEKLSTDVAKKIAELNKQNEISSTASEKEEEKKPEEPPEGKEEGKNVDIANHPLVKQLLDKVNKLSAAQEDLSKAVKEKDATIDTLTAKNNEAEIGDLLAAHEYNFFDPETGKVDPSKWEAAYEYLKSTGWNKKQIETLLSKITPFGTKARKTEAEQLITQKASTNRGVPKYNAAFGEEAKEPPTEEAKEKIESASTNRVDGEPAGIKLVRRFVSNNNLE